MKAKLIAAAACGLLLSGAVQVTVQAAELKVLASGVVKEAYAELVPQFEKSSGNKVTITWAGMSRQVTTISLPIGWSPD